MLAPTTGIAAADTFEKTYDPLRNMPAGQVAAADPANAAQARLGAELYGGNCTTATARAGGGGKGWARQ